MADIRRTKVRGLAAALLAVLALASCSHSGSPVRSIEVYRQCNERLGPTLGALEDLRSRLVRRITEPNYEHAVNEAMLHYRAFDPRDVDETCLRSAGTQAELALRSYVEALDRWTECAGNRYCDPDLLKIGLELQWVAASKQLDKARAGLESLRP